MEIILKHHNGVLAPLRMRPYQERMLDRMYDYSHNAILACRQSGKGIVALKFAIDRAHQGKKTLIIGPRVRMNPLALLHTDALETPTHLSINRGTVNFIVPHSEIFHFDTIEQYDHIIIDEAAYISNTHMMELMEWLDIIKRKQTITMLTTPSTFKGECHSLYTNENQYVKTFIRPMLCPRLIRKANEMKRNVDYDTFRRECLLKW